MLDIQNIIGKPKIYVNQVDERTYIFELQYLPRGFGYTLGNSIRRVILGYCTGGAVTGLKIKGVPHEYYVLDGLKEAVIDIMLSFKKLRFKIYDNVESLQWISQRFKSIGKYYSKDLKLPSGIELLCDDVYLFEITDPGLELVIDFRIEKGYGYYNIEFLRKREEKEEASDIGLFLIDNDFKSVEYIKYEVEEVIDDFMGGSKDKIKLEIKTISKTISPKDLVTFAGEVISSYAKLFVFDDIYIDKSMFTDYLDIEEGKEKVGDDLEIKTMPIDALPLSERTRNALIKNEILYVEDLEKKRKNELLSMKGVGRKAVEEITIALHNISKSLAG